MARITQERDVTLHPRPERVVHAQLPLAHLALGHELEHAHNEGTKVGVHFEHRTLVGPGRPRRGWLCCEIDVWLGGGDVEGCVS
jgi:hypothetical protein